MVDIGPRAAVAALPAGEKRRTKLGFTANMGVSLVPQKYESGGVLLFEKNASDEKDTLRCMMVCTTQGDERGISGFIHATARFTDRKSLMLFHTHPAPTREQVQDASFMKRNVLLLSKEDLEVMLTYSFILEHTADVGRDSKTTHLLSTPDYMLFTRFGTSAFNHQLRLVNGYKSDRGLDDATAIDDYIAGMRALFNAYETHMIERITTTPGKNSDLERKYVDEILDNCAFAPDDPITSSLLDDKYLPVDQKNLPYLKWAFGGGKVPVKLPSTEGELPGLFNSWHMNTEEFKVRGILDIPDGGKTYDNEEHYTTDDPPALRFIHNAGEGAMVSGSPERRPVLPPADAPKSPPSPPGIVRGVQAEQPSPASSGASMSPPSVPRMGGNRSTYRRPPSGPKQTVPHPSFSKHRPSTRRRLT